MGLALRTRRLRHAPDLDVGKSGQWRGQPGQRVQAQICDLLRHLLLLRQRLPGRRVVQWTMENAECRYSCAPRTQMHDNPPNRWAEPGNCHARPSCAARTKPNENSSLERIRAIFKEEWITQVYTKLFLRMLTRSNQLSCRPWMPPASLLNCPLSLLHCPVFPRAPPGPGSGCGVCRARRASGNSGRGRSSPAPPPASASHHRSAPGGSSCG